MHLTVYLITILLTAFTGWMIIWGMLKMLFHPVKPIKIAGFTFQGIIPKNQQLIAQKLGQAVSKEFLSFDSIEQKISSPENLQKLKPTIEAHIDDFLRNKLKEVFPMLSMLIGDKTINQLKDAFLSELETLFPLLMKEYMNQLQQDLDIEKTVSEKITGLSLEKLEKNFLQHTRKQFMHLQLVGAIFGFVIGLIQVCFMLLLW